MRQQDRVRDAEALRLSAWFEMAPAADGGGRPSGAGLWQVGDESDCERLFQDSLAADEADLAAAAVVAALLVIWESGRDLERVERWLQRAQRLVTPQRGASPPAGDSVAADHQPGALARAAVAAHAFTVRWMWRSEVDAQLADLPALREVVDRADSDALRIFAAASEAYLLLMAGEVHAARVCVRDAEYFAPASDAAQFPKLHLAAVGALVDAFSGQSRRAAQRLAALLEQSDSAGWPLHVQLTLRGHLLMSLAESGQVDRARQAALALRSLAIPGNRAYHRSYLHYALGVGALLAGQAGEALAHARSAVAIGRLSGSVAAQLIPALLQVQALADLGRLDEALALLDACEPRWQVQGMRLQQAAAACERAALWRDAGNTDRAREAWALACRIIPVGEPMPHLHRKADFLAELLPALGLEAGLAMHSSGPAETDDGAVNASPAGAVAEPVVRIRTLGDFALSVAGRPIREAQWKGNRGKTLLKLIVALGGRQVPADRLADALWPDADGARARANLKVLVWRLRRLAASEGREPPPWLTMGHGQVSLDRALCRVDALELGASAQATVADWPACAALLRGQTGEFLPNDEALPFVLERRELLQRIQVDTAVRAAQLLPAGVPDDAVHETIGWLQQAQAIRPHNEHCAQWLMVLLMRRGLQAEALAVFARIRDRLSHDLGLPSPGAALCALRDEALAVPQSQASDRWC